MKFGLRGIRRLLRFLDHPERQFPSLHIAGTNGKGSTASMIASIFTSAGYKTGLYTSPHLIRFNERIRIDGKPISSSAVTRLVGLLRSEGENYPYTFFETVTAIALKYFAESHVDIAVVETGLGGRLDATNVLHPLVSVITSIGLEHTHILGPNLEDIAFEKGGIIKRGVPCITGAKSRSAIQVLQKICKRQKTQLLRIYSSGIHLKKSSLKGIRADYRFGRTHLKDVFISLAGEHQALNALLALCAVRTVVRNGMFKIHEEDIRNGLGNIRKYSGLQARLSILQKKPLLLADVAHNPDAIRTLCKSLQRLYHKKIYIVFGLMQDKNAALIAAALHRVAKRIFTVQARTDRSRPAATLAGEFHRWGTPVEICTDVKSGLMKSLQKKDSTPILITGSHFVVGEALAFLKKEKYLTINQ
jgi:dihydrofolate synthase / folylpolyglutamate synthase